MSTPSVICTVLVMMVLLIIGTFADYSRCDNRSCASGNCDDTCVCAEGWQGPNCNHCGGKIKLVEPVGFIHDGPGNYTINVKCSWLIETEGFTNAIIRLHIEEFDTECGWDKLYIYDGDSVDSPLLAVFSGLMYKDSYAVRSVPEVIAKSGSVFLHFNSDDAYNMSGFNISYAINACPSRYSNVNCSGHGHCEDSICTCDNGWTGKACDEPTCPGNCSYSLRQGICVPLTQNCRCQMGFGGQDCSQPVKYGIWEPVKMGYFKPSGSASHGAIVSKDFLYIVSGEGYGSSHLMYTYDFNGGVWEIEHSSSSLIPNPRYGASAVIHNDKIFLYGGVVTVNQQRYQDEVAFRHNFRSFESAKTEVTDELWTFNINTNTWENITIKNKSCKKNVVMCGPLRSAGHTATVITFAESHRKLTEKMIVIFGHSPIFGYLNTVQEYNFDTRKWVIVKTRGYPVKGGYGHTAAYDLFTEKIYVYGGIIPDSENNQILSSDLYSYDPSTKIWELLAQAPGSQFLHSANFIMPGMMIVFGGNTQNENSHSFNAKCYSDELLAYDVACDSWHYMTIPLDLRDNIARYGHSGTVFENSLYLYGGFDGQMLNDMIRFTPGHCHNLTTQNECLNSKPGIKCIWEISRNKCINITEVSKDFLRKLDSEYASNFMKCPEKSKNEMTHKTLFNKIINSKDSGHIYTSSCAYFTSCTSCTQQECIWCQNEARCVDKNAYIVSFPYGQCREWTTFANRCRIPPNFDDSLAGSTISRTDGCMAYVSCSHCREDPACGWCDDGSETGSGICLPGGAASPISPSSCLHHNWYFTQCSSCQCNGHSTCLENSSVCIQPCESLTIGKHCEQCSPGNWGNPLNGGKCQPCECNDQVTLCNPDSGKCYCTTKGSIGDRCDKCDATNRYHSDPTNKKFCYYELIANYQFTFNMSKTEDRHFTKINFRYSPTESNIDVNFFISCSVLAKMNMTIRTNDGREETIFNSLNCTTFTYRFAKADHKFGVENNGTLTTFFVYVYDFQTPLWIQISFSQNPTLNLQQFFIAFSSFFILLLFCICI